MAEFKTGQRVTTPDGDTVTVVKPDCMGGLCVHVRDDEGIYRAWPWVDLSPVDEHDQDQDTAARAATADLVAALWSAYLGLDVTPEDVTNLCKIGKRIVERYRAEVGQ